MPPVVDPSPPGPSSASDPSSAAAAATAGLTLPVWVAAAARAALLALRQEPFQAEQPLELLQPPGRRNVPVRAAARLADGWALGESLCDPGRGLDLTRGLLVWVLVRWGAKPESTAPNEPASAAAAGAAGEPGQNGDSDAAEWLQIEAGEGVGVLAGSGAACLSTYARQLLAVNLRPLLSPNRTLRLRVVLPSGRELAQRTSNAAFGVVDGLALIGTQAEVQAGASPDQLQGCLEQLSRRTGAAAFDGDLVLVIGENGLDLAPRLGLPAPLLLKVGNWLGPVLVAAAEQGVRRLLLFGYQGKLLKLAGGIFHTHHHLADGRAEVLTALAALEGLTGPALLDLNQAPTVEAAFAGLEARDPAFAERLRQRLAAAIEARSLAYVQRHTASSEAGAPLQLGAVLFDRSRRVRACGPVGATLFSRLGGTP